MTTVSQQAYVKAVLHACKFPYYAVNGVLIGYEAENVEIVDAIPLFHGHLSLIPLLEAALMQIDSSLDIKNKNSNQQLQIVGYYFANEHEEDLTISSLHTSIVNKIAKNFSKATLWMIDNERLDKLETDLVIHTHSLNEKTKKWDRTNTDNLAWKAREARVDEKVVVEALAGHIAKKTYRDLIDFETHVDDISKSYENKELV